MRKKIKLKEEYNAEINEITVCLLNEYQWLEILFDSENPYKKLLHHLHALGELMKDDKLNNEHKLSKLSETLNERKTILSKWLRQIYEDLLSINFEKPELFKIDGCHLYRLYCRDANADINAHLNLWLTIPLQRYDEFECFFLRGKFPISRFYVETIYHEHIFGKQETTAWLKVGFPNQYRDHLFDRAVFEQEMSSVEQYQKLGFKIDEELRKLYK
jgi:hypothetical protein